VGYFPPGPFQEIYVIKKKYFVPPLAEQIVNFTKNGIIDNLKEKKKRGQAKCPLLIPHGHYSSVFRG
jgi:hypothetical protein